MNDNRQPPEPIQTATKSPKAGKPADIRKDLAALQPPISPHDRDKFLKRLFDSPLVHAECFVLAVDSLCGRERAKLLPFTDSILAHLSDGMDGQFRLETLPTTKDVTEWVSSALLSPPASETSTPGLKTNRPYWVLYQVLRCRGVGSKFGPALQAFVNTVAKLDEEGSHQAKKTAVRELPSTRVVKSIVARIPPDFTHGKPLLEALSQFLTFVGLSDEILVELECALTETSSLGAEVRRLSESLEVAESRVDELSKEIDALRAAGTQARANSRDMESTLESARAHHQQEIDHALAELKAKVTKKAGAMLEDARLYLDRAQPNTGGALGQITKLEEMLKNL